MAEEFIHIIGSDVTEFAHTVGSDTTDFTHTVVSPMLEINLTSHPIWNYLSANGDVLVTGDGTGVYALGFTLIHPEKTVKITKR